MPIYQFIRAADLTLTVLAVAMAMMITWPEVSSAQAWEGTLDFSDSSFVTVWDTAWAVIPVDDTGESFYGADSHPGCDSPWFMFGNTGISYSAGHPAKPRREQPGDVDRGDCPPYRYRMADCDRAGRPHRVAWWAAPSINKKYSAWFVGGGAAIGGRSRVPSEGTWGLDYQGSLSCRRVWLPWTCGRSQGGEGAYQSDGHTGPLSRH